MYSTVNQYGSEKGKVGTANGVCKSFRTDKKPAFHPFNTALLPQEMGRKKDAKDKEKESGRSNDHAKLVEARAELQGRSDPLHWVSLFVF